MIGEFRINIRKLIDFRRAGDNITVGQKKQFDYDIANLSKACMRLVHDEYKHLTKDQLHFVNILLGQCIIYDTPKLEEILAVFDLSMDDIFCEDVDDNSIR